MKEMEKLYNESCLGYKMYIHTTLEKKSREAANGTGEEILRLMSDEVR